MRYKNCVEVPDLVELDKDWPRDLNREPLKDIVNQAKKITLLITSMVFGLSSHSDAHLTSHLAFDQA